MKKFLRFLFDPMRYIGRNSVTDIIIDFLAKHPVVLALFALLITLAMMAVAYVLPGIRG